MCDNRGGGGLIQLYDVLVWYLGMYVCVCMSVHIVCTVEKIRDENHVLNAQSDQNRLQYNVQVLCIYPIVLIGRVSMISQLCRFRKPLLCVPLASSV